MNWLVMVFEQFIVLLFDIMISAWRSRQTRCDIESLPLYSPTPGRYNIVDASVHNTCSYWSNLKQGWVSNSRCGNNLGWANYVGLPNVSNDNSEMTWKHRYQSIEQDSNLTKSAWDTFNQHLILITYKHQSTRSAQMMIPSLTSQVSIRPKTEIVQLHRSPLDVGPDPHQRPKR
jgi:hypothetical protein